MSAPAASWPGTGLAARTAGSRTDGLPDSDLERGGEHEVGDAREAARVLGDERRLPDRHAVRRDQREAVLGLEDDGREAGPREGLGARQDLALDLGVARARSAPGRSRPCA